jgi:hypothetical protein
MNTILEKIALLMLLLALLVQCFFWFAPKKEVEPVPVTFPSATVLMADGKKAHFPASTYKWDFYVNDNFELAKGWVEVK